ncbi:MAG: KamA family radical SAM protein [Desulfamplus sp.]|nr:KamA family radical SAM protein [Desulfamplus sp.]
MIDTDKYCPEYLLSNIPEIFDIARQYDDINEFRKKAAEYVHTMQYETFNDFASLSEGRLIRVRDCAQVINQFFTFRSEEKSQFSVAQAISDIARNVPRPDLTPAFYAEIFYLFLGLHGRSPRPKFADYHLASSEMEGREAAIERSSQLDTLSEEVSKYMNRYSDGLESTSVARREKRRDHILKILNGSLENWYDWRWQYSHVMRDADKIQQLVNLTSDQARALRMAKTVRIPFGITPYYLSLMDEDPDSGRDCAIRAQVLPPSSYVDQVSEYGKKDRSCLDFMRETDTSPIDLITRRYPSICIFKPFNTCPQICVYCQRNWEIEDAMMPGSMASEEKIIDALKWIKEHPAIHEVLITGGDPLGMDDVNFERILAGVAEIPSVERIRIGTRTLVTAPMRITENLVNILDKYKQSGQCQIAVVTHIQHSYEITPDTAKAVEMLRSKSISVFNQLVYTFFTSRRFEAAYLRRNLTRIGVEPYYSFNTKGKEETLEYRVPIARLLQEQKEEARLLPGISRTDEAVYNVPGMGKNYLRARQHRELISVLPDGTRLYEFHPWEKNITRGISTHIGQDVPILDYLIRLNDAGEDVSDYETIWYYF